MLPPVIAGAGDLKNILSRCSRTNQGLDKRSIGTAGIECRDRGVEQFDVDVSALSNQNLNRESAIQLHTHETFPWLEIAENAQRCFE